MARIFGIDLGTTNSLIAAMENGAPRVIASRESGKALLPSVVAIAPDGAVTVGERAIEMEPHLTVERDGRVSAVGYPGGEYGAVIRSVKRYMGLGGDELAPEDRARYPSPTSPGRWSGSRLASAFSPRRKFPPRFCAHSKKALSAHLPTTKEKKSS